MNQGIFKVSLVSKMRYAIFFQLFGVGDRINHLNDGHVDTAKFNSVGHNVATKSPCDKNGHVY